MFMLKWVRSKWMHIGINHDYWSGLYDRTAQDDIYRKKKKIVKFFEVFLIV